MRPEGRYWFYPGQNLKMPLMIPASLHGYAVRSVLHRLVHADVGNVRSWHRADAVQANVRYER